MATIRVSNIEAKADASSPTINEKVKITNSNGDVMLQLDGATSGITTVGINSTAATFTVDDNQNFNFVGIITAANINTTGVTTITTLNVTSITGISTISADSSVYINQNLVFPSGKGVDFSATTNSSGTMTSELLDDYEEGTWTPTIRLSGGTGDGQTFSPPSIYKGRYVKIGDMVYIETYARFNLSAIASNGWTFAGTTITGLPYASGGQDAQQYSPIFIGYLSNFYSGFPTTNNNFAAGYVISNGSQIILTINNPNGAETGITNNVLSTSASGGIMFGAYYRASNSG